MFRRKNLQRRRKVMICRPKGQTVPGEVETGSMPSKHVLVKPGASRLRKGPYSLQAEKASYPWGMIRLASDISVTV